MTTQTRHPADVLPRGAGAHLHRSRPERLVATCRTAARPAAAGARPAPLRAAPVRLTLPAGDLRALDSTGLRAQLAAVQQPGTSLVLDLSAVVSVDAAVVGVLLAADRRLRPTGAAVVLTGARPRVARALGVAGAQGLLAA